MFMTVIGGWRCSHLSLSWMELSKYCTPKTFMDLAGPWVFLGLSPNLGGMYVVPRLPRLPQERHDLSQSSSVQLRQTQRSRQRRVHCHPRSPERGH